MITEGLIGKEENVLLVKGPNPSKNGFSTISADLLIDLAIYYGFDGWFFNIESGLAGTNLSVNDFLSFLSYIRNKIHERIPGSLIICNTYFKRRV